MDEDDVQFGRKKAGQRHRCAKTDRYAHAGYTQRQVTRCAAFHRYKNH